jgi:hypothetical protein
MKIKSILPYLVIATGLASSAMAQTVSTYQVTGPVLEVSDAKIVIQKGKGKWEIARTPGTKVTGDLKVGEKVTVQYSMTATAVEVKPEKEKKAAAPETAPATPTAPTTGTTKKAS